MSTGRGLRGVTQAVPGKLLEHGALAVTVLHRWQSDAQVRE